MTQTTCKWARTVFIIRLTLFFVSEAYYGYKKGDIIILDDNSTNSTMMLITENLVRRLYPSFVYWLILVFLAASNDVYARPGCCAPWLSIYPIVSRLLYDIYMFSFLSDSGYDGQSTELMVTAFRGRWFYLVKIGYLFSKTFAMWYWSLSFLFL